MDYAFTRDIFKCGICNEEKSSVDEYVTHMLEVEKCIMVMESSTYLKDLMLPRFKRRAAQKIEEALMDKETSLLNYPKGVEIEVGNGILRWKCRMCCLTFSREAALLNHFKLTEHEIIGTPQMKKEPLLEKQVKTEIKDIFPEEMGNSEQCFNEESVKSPINPGNPLCNICGQIFKSVSIVSAHMKIVHSEKRPFICKIDGCSLSFKTKGSLVRHIRRHTGDRPYKCQRCGRAYRESGSLLRHHQSKIPCDQKPDSHLPRYGITQPFDSDTKNQTLSELDCKLPLKKEKDDDDLFMDHNEDSEEMEETKAKVRKEILNRYTDYSSSTLPSSLSDRNPIMNMKETKSENMSWDGSEEKKPSKIDQTRLEEDKILRLCFLCPVCYKSYSKSSALSTHMKLHLSELGKECYTCKKRFTSNHSLSRHLLTHSSVRQFECQECGKSFKLKSHASAHLKSHSSVKSVPCTECGRYFKSVSSRNNHMKIHSGERNFECAMCFKKFLAKASFIRHLKVHMKGKRELRFKDESSSVSEIKLEDVETKSLIEDVDTKEGALSEIKDKFSEIDSEIESYLSEKWDISSIYSEHSDLSFSPEDYLIPNVGSIEPVTSEEFVKREVKKDVT